jgi:predicted PurR-regulated permease PerM
VIDVGSFLAERRYSALVLLIAVFTAFLVLFISWPWVNVILLTLWAAYILWFPARWLERRIHRRVLSSFIVMLIIIVFYLLMLFQVVFILANELTSFQLAAGTANTTLSSAFAQYFYGGPVPTVTNVSVNAGQAGSSILTAFVNAALGIIQGIITGAPLYIFELLIVTLLVWYLLVNGDHIVAEFKSLAPRNHRSSVNTFLGHLNLIYHAL